FTPSADVAATLSPLIKSRDNPDIEERFIGRSPMRGRQRWLGAAVALLAAASSGAQAQAALTGLVSSSEEGAMEGVLVSAKKEGSTITATGVTDEQGRYSFPAARMEPGKYTISIRAIGYKLEGPKTVDVPTGNTATADLKLGKVKSLVSQLSNAEWLLSLPGADKQKAFLTMCVGCHTLQRVLTSNHDAAEFQQVFLRMARYSPGSTPTHPQPLLPGPRGERPAVTGDAAKAAAEFLASVSLGNSEAIEYPLKTLPPPRAGPPKSSSRNTICRARARFPTTSSSIRMGRFGLRFRRPIRGRHGPEERNDQGHCDPGGAARAAERRPRPRVRPRRQYLAGDDVSGRHRQDRSQDARSLGIPLPEGMDFDLGAGFDGVADLFERRRQGMDQQSGGSPQLSARSGDRQVRESRPGQAARR